MLYHYISQKISFSEKLFTFIQYKLLEPFFQENTLIFLRKNLFLPIILKNFHIFPDSCRCAVLPAWHVHLPSGTSFFQNNAQKNPPDADPGD